jgi:hypothetical protein
MSRKVVPGDRGRDETPAAFVPVSEAWKDFEAVHFIDHGSSGVETKIWDCAFEPDPERPWRTTSTVATCGGNTINIIDVSTGEVSMRYNCPR